MYVFKIKDNSAALDVAVLRVLFLAAAVGAVFFTDNTALTVRYISVTILLVMSLFAKVFLLSRNFSKYLLLTIGAALVFIASHSLMSIFLFFIAGILPGLFYKAPMVEADKESVVLKRMIGSSTYRWTDFSNVILKDSLLTLDFKNNKVLQLEIDEKTVIDEKAFNDFCASKIIQ